MSKKTGLPRDTRINLIKKKDNKKSEENIKKEEINKRAVYVYLKNAHSNPTFDWFAAD